MTLNTISFDLERYQAKRLFEILDETDLLPKMIGLLKQVGQRNLLETNKYSVLQEKLIFDIAMKRPFSLLRLGDGEGNTLFWNLRREEFPELSRLCMDKIWKLTFGKNTATVEMWNALGNSMQDAITKASYIGIPTYGQASAALLKLKEPLSEEFDIRGNVGVISVWDWINSKNECLQNDVIYVKCHVHNILLEFYSELVKVAGNLSVITCYPEVMGRLHRSCKVNSGTTYLIPPQAVNIKGTPKDIHYPTRFDEISLDLSSKDLTGRLFFIGGGLVGKIYCDIVRRSGGMALDVGSLMDVWMGLGVRPYQSSSFVKKHKIIDNLGN